jgi:hypothetical protein
MFRYREVQKTDSCRPTVFRSPSFITVVLQSIQRSGFFSSLQSSELGHPLTRKQVLPPLWIPGGGGAQTLAVEKLGGPDSDEGTDTLVLYVLYNHSTGRMIRLHARPLLSLPPSPVSKLDRRHIGRLTKRAIC